MISICIHPLDFSIHVFKETALKVLVHQIGRGEGEEAVTNQICEFKTFFIKKQFCLFSLSTLVVFFFFFWCNLHDYEMRAVQLKC